MSRPTPSSMLRFLFMAFVLLLGAAPGWGQATSPVPHGYDFLTVLTVKSYNKKQARILLTPAFQGKSVIALADVSPYATSAQDTEQLAQNTLLINQQLSALTAAGWELVQLYPVAPIHGDYNPSATRYLFRKPRP